MSALRRLAALLAVPVLVAALVSCAGKNAVDNTHYTYRATTPKGQTYPQAERKLAQPFTGTKLDGSSYQLADDLGKIVVINFWATWCPPCVVETPQLDSVYQDFKAKGVQVVGIDTKDAKGSAQAFVTNNDISFPVVFDEKAEIALRLGNLPVQGLPFSLLVDKHGKVAALYVGPVTPADLEPVLNSLLAET
jgi:peroxiredoxin